MKYSHTKNSPNFSKSYRNVKLLSAILPGLSDPSELEQFVVKEQSGYLCSICSVFRHNTKHHVRNHVESKHFPNSFVYSCPTCGKEVSTRKALERHKTSCKKQSANVYYQQPCYNKCMEHCILRSRHFYCYVVASFKLTTNLCLQQAFRTALS